MNARMLDFLMNRMRVRGAERARAARYALPTLETLGVEAADAPFVMHDAMRQVSRWSFLTITRRHA